MNTIAELTMLAQWVRRGEYNLEDARDEIARAIENRIKTLEVSKEKIMKIFVFGSNRGGIHGAGAAKFAIENRGAKWGQGEGLQGMSYAIPTKKNIFKSLPLVEIKEHVDTFLEFARNHPGYTFEVTPIGCGLAGYTANDIAPLFEGIPENVELPPIFSYILLNKTYRAVESLLGATGPKNCETEVDDIYQKIACEALSKGT